MIMIPFASMMEKVGLIKGSGKVAAYLAELSNPTRNAVLCEECVSRSLIVCEYGRAARSCVCWQYLPCRLLCARECIIAFLLDARCLTNIRLVWCVRAVRCEHKTAVLWWSVSPRLRNQASPLQGRRYESQYTPCIRFTHDACNTPTLLLTNRDDASRTQPCTCTWWIISLSVCLSVFLSFCLSVCLAHPAWWMLSCLVVYQSPAHTRCIDTRVSSRYTYHAYLHVHSTHINIYIYTHTLSGCFASCMYSVPITTR